MSFQTLMQSAYDSGTLSSLLEKEKTLGAICKALGYSAHGRNTAALSIFFAKNNIVFENHTQKTQELETRKCIHCGSEFTVPIHNKKESKRLTCSHACSGAHPEFIRNRVNAKIGMEPTHYITIAKRAGLNSCCICNEKEVVDIHHLDEDSSNNSIDNLVPLCPTHHAYMHRGKSSLILDKLIDYLDTRVLTK